MKLNKQKLKRLPILVYNHIRNKMRSDHVNLEYKKIYELRNPMHDQDMLVKEKVLGMDMIMPLTQDGIQKDLLVHGIREEDSTRFMFTQIKEGDVVIDAGANIGYYVNIERKLVGMKGMVYAVEPVKRNFEILDMNMKLHPRPYNVYIERTAFGDKDSNDEKIFLSTHCNLHSFVKDIHQTNNTEKVKMVKLDTFVKNRGIERLDFIRMDVEGYEVFIIKGAWQTLLKYKPKLFIEIHPKHVLNTPGCSIEAMLRDLRAIGYETTHVSCADLVEKLSISDLIQDDRVRDMVDIDRKSGKKATFRVFFEAGKA